MLTINLLLPCTKTGVEIFSKHSGKAAISKGMEMQAIPYFFLHSCVHHICHGNEVPNGKPSLRLQPFICNETNENVNHADDDMYNSLMSKHINKR